MAAELINEPDLNDDVLSSIQPVLTYSVNWGTNNVYQKLSGKTYIAPNGQTVDCSTIIVTFSSSQHFKKFYATAVKDGNDYGFIDDILVDIRQINPTGVLLYELTYRNANVNFSFTIDTSSLTAGDGQYRIGLYIQNDDNIWNYEYFLVDVDGNQLADNNGYNLQVPVITEIIIPDYVKNEADATIAKALAHNITGNKIRFIACSDAHNDSNGKVTTTATGPELSPYLTEKIRAGNLHAGQAMEYISNRLSLDFIAYLGDTTWAGTQSSSYTLSELTNDILEVWDDISDAFRNTPQIRCVGNHDQYYTTTGRLLNSGAYPLFGNYCSGIKNSPGGYGYLDLDDIKVRVIYLNTSDLTNETAGGTKLQFGQAQTDWLASTLIKVGDKTGWYILILSHAPLSKTTNVNNVSIASLLEAYANGTSYSNYNFAGHNNAHLLSNVHGHVHSYTYGYIQDKIRRFTIPNMCFGDNNHYNNRAGYEGLYDTTTYNKTADSGKDTAFSLVTIDLDNKYCYVDNYGAGIDRSFSVDYNTSKIPISISNISYIGSTIIGDPININDISYIVNYNDSSTASLSGNVTISPSTIQQVGNNTISINYTENNATVSSTFIITGTAAPVVDLLNLTGRNYQTIPVGDSIGLYLSENIGILNTGYGSRQGVQNPCSISNITSNSITVTESGIGGNNIAIPININGSSSITISFDYSGAGKTRFYYCYANSNGTTLTSGVSLVPSSHVSSTTAGASGSFSTTLSNTNNYTWLILMPSSNTGQTKTYSNIELTISS